MKMFNENLATLMPWYIRIEEGVDDKVRFCAVDVRGRWLVSLVFIDRAGLHLYPNAKNLLDEAGYDTTHTRWNDDGSIRIA